MPARHRQYEQFGPFILFKRLELDALGDLWRGARIDGARLGAAVAVRRLSGGNREALVQSANNARALVPLLTGTTFAKEQSIDLIDGVPFVAHEYGGGRSLRHIVDRARGASGTTPNPIPIDQAILIAEKIALSLSTTADLRYLGNRLTHGALIPQFVWIADDGEVRVAGQQLGKGIIASLADVKVAAEIARYFPPEYHSAGEPAKTTDAYSMGAILYLLVTGNEPPDAVGGSAFANSIRAAKTMAGQPMPDDIRAILEKSLVIDATARYPAIGDMKQAISALAHGGKYSATTFNLAFYLSSLLKKEMEGEALDREKESKLNVAAYVEQAASAPTSAAVAPFPPPSTGDRPPAKGRAAMIAAAAAIIVVGGGAGFMLLRNKPATAAPAPAKKAPAPFNAQIAAPAVAASSPAPVSATPATSSNDPAAKKAFEHAVEQKLQEEMMKLQSAYTQQLKQQQSKNAPVKTPGAAPVKTPNAAPVLGRVTESAVADDRAASAAQFDQRRLAARQETTSTQALTTAPPLAQQPPAAPPQTQTQTQTQPPAPTPTQPDAAGVREGDVIEYGNLDRAPEPLGVIRADYPRLAMRQQAKGTVIVSALISENGDVIDVKILKSDARFGFNEAAIRAMRAARFTAPIKNGKRVRTWRPQTFLFSL
jgi:protein TonB